METEIKRFRGKILGGFNRKDVSEYIEKLAGERNALRKRCRELEEQTAQFAQRSAQLQQQSARLQAESGAVQARAEKAEKELTALAEKQAEQLEAALAEERARAEKELAAEREKAREEAAARVAEKLDEIGGLLDCVAEDSARDAQEARDRLEALCSGAEASAHATEEARRRFLALRKELEQDNSLGEKTPDECGACVAEEAEAVPVVEEVPAEDSAESEETVFGSDTESPYATQMTEENSDAAVPAECSAGAPTAAFQEVNGAAGSEFPSEDFEARAWTGVIPEE